MTKSEIIRFLILRSVGNFLVLFMLFGVGATFGPALFYEVQFRIIQLRGVRYSVAAPAQTSPSPLGDTSSQQTTAPIASGFSSVLLGPREQILIAKDTDFSILIPKIGASAKVFPNIDSTDEALFLPLLQQGVAHAKGTVFPGMKGNIYLFAHSTDDFWEAGRYNAVFYLLKDLAVGDEIVVFFENRRHNYSVTDTKVIEPEDVSYLVNSQTGSETLILQTCWPPGTTWKRYLVIAKPK